MENNLVPQIPDDASDLEKIFKQMKDSVRTGETKSLKFREKALDALIEGYEKMKPQLDQALNKDLGHNSFMCNFGAHAITMTEVKDIRKSLSSWVKAEKVETPLGTDLMQFSFGPGFLSN